MPKIFLVFSFFAVTGNMEFFFSLNPETLPPNYLYCSQSDRMIFCCVLRDSTPRFVCPWSDSWLVGLHSMGGFVHPSVHSPSVVHWSVTPLQKPRFWLFSATVRSYTESKIGQTYFERFICLILHVICLVPN